MVRPERLVMSFRWAFGGAPEEIGNISRVEMELRAIGDGTELTFTHANLIAASTPSASKPSHEQGWSAALDKLARCMAGVDTPWLAENEKASGT
jgi:uncharacterized protein YndB with AHSA1/START domain